MKMNNYELDEIAHELIRNNSPFQLARRVLDLENEIQEQRKAILAARRLAGVV